MSERRSVLQSERAGHHSLVQLAKKQAMQCYTRHAALILFLVVQELPSKEVERAIDAPDDSSLNPAAHGAAAATNLHKLPSGKMAVAPADVLKVASANELYDAVQQGIRDILLTEHMDLSTQAPDDLGFVLPLLPSTRSIRVRPLYLRCAMHSVTFPPCGSTGTCLVIAMSRYCSDFYSMSQRRISHRASTYHRVNCLPRLQLQRSALVRLLEPRHSEVVPAIL